MCEVLSQHQYLLQVQCTGVVPTVAIDKVDGCQVSSIVKFQSSSLPVTVSSAARALQGDSPALQLVTSDT